MNRVSPRHARTATSRACGVLLASLLCACQGPPTQGSSHSSRSSALSSTGGEDGYFYGLGDARVPLRFAPNRLGLVTRERAGRKQVSVIARLFQLEVVSELSGGFFVLAGGGLDTRAEVASLAWKLAAAFPQVIRAAGFVVEDELDPNPQLIGDELLVRFHPQTGDSAVTKVFDALALEVVRRGRGGTYRVRVTDATGLDALDAARYLREQSHGATGAEVMMAEPNRHFVAQLFETLPADPAFAAQWHHRNTGPSGGTVDADADSTLAWDLTMGAASTVIAVVDNAFDLAHEDLAPNLYTNAAELPGNGLDDDGNGYVDDVNGWDFVSDDADPNPVGAGDNHGTAVTGVAIARAGNGLGVVGACPSCRYLPLSVFNNCGVGGFGCASNVAAFAEAIEYAAFSDAQIITNSWGKSNPAAAADAAVVLSIDDATALGKVVLFAGGNSPSSAYCNAGYPSLPNVIAVSSSSNRDRKVNGHAFGDCIDVLAPTRWGGADSPAPTGTLAVTTTDRTGGAGYNSVDGICAGGLSEGANTSYTSCFSGTSSATPLVAGAAGLLVTARPSLTRVEVQRLLQDTTDRIEDSLGSYSSAVGYSQPGGAGTHAFGRLNAFEAVRIAAPAPAGRAGVDVFVRDNRLDWGNTEQPSNVTFEPTRGYLGHWRSVDIKIDQPPYQPVPTDPAGFESLSDEPPLEGAINKVYVRVRNRGPVTASAVTVKLHYTQFGTALPALPADFWTVFPADSADTSQWHPLGVTSLTDVAYSGPSVAGCPGRAAPDCGGATDAAQIASFDWLGPSVPMGTPNHFCLFAVLDSAQDPISAASMASLIPDVVTPNDNNVTHRNVQVQLAGAGGDSELERTLFVRNPLRGYARTVLRLSVPKEWRVIAEGLPVGEPFTLKPGAEALVRVKVLRPDVSARGEVELTQELHGQTQEGLIRGGAVLEFSGKHQ